MEKQLQARRRSPRLKEYDYAQPGAYFVTIVTQNRSSLFGDVTEGTIQLNVVGELIKFWWKELKNRFPVIETDEFVIMPNHLHGIIIVVDPTVGADRRVGPDRAAARPANQGAHIGAPLPRIIQWFKTMTTNEYIRGVKQLGWTPFHEQLWQRGYFDHVIRNDASLNRIRQYIIENPARWHFDRENPALTKV
jgi:REP element-mobilizing transposase RayT